MYTGQVERNFLDYIYIYFSTVVEKCTLSTQSQSLTEVEKLQLQLFLSFDERNRFDFLSFEILFKITLEIEYLEFQQI